MEFSLNSGKAAPIHKKRWRYTPEQVQGIKMLLDKMLQNGIIEPGKGQWGFSVVLVRKKSGKWRCCAEFQKLNAVTK